MSEGEHYWFKVKNEFACDSAFLEVADRCNVKPGTVQSVVLQLRGAINAGKKLGPDLLGSIAWYCREPVELVRRIVKVLIALGRLAPSVLASLRASRPRHPSDSHRLRQARYRARKRQDRRQLNLLLPISAGPPEASREASPPVTRSLKSLETEAPHPVTPPSREASREASPPVTRSLKSLETEAPQEASRGRHPPSPAPQIEEIESEHIERKRESENAKPDSRPAARLGLSAEEARIRDNRFWLITWGRRWAEHTTYRAEERDFRLALCERMLAHLDSWDQRSRPDVRAFEHLVKNMRRHPLDPAFRRAFAGGPDPGLAALLARQAWVHGRRVV